MTKATRDSGCADTGNRAHIQVRPAPPPAATAPPGGARGDHALARRAPRRSLWWLGHRGSGGALLRGAGPRRGRSRARGGSGWAAGDGWGGQLPGAAREDVATAPRCPSAPETPPRRSPEPPCLRRPRPGSGPSPPRCGSPGGRPRQVRKRRRRRRWDTRGARPGWGPGGGRGGSAARPRVSPGCLEAPPLCGARPGTLPASLEVSAAGAARTCPIKSPFKESISPVGAVPADGYLQVSPKAFQDCGFSWLLGARCLFAAEETESGTRRPGAPYKGTSLSSFLVEEPLRLLGRRRLEFGGLVEKFGNVIPPPLRPLSPLGICPPFI